MPNQAVFKNKVASVFAPALAAIALGMPTPGHAAMVTSTGQGPVNLGVLGPEFSGITHAGGNLYYAVSDNDTQLYPITVDLDLSTGQVTSTSIGATQVLSGVGGAPLSNTDYEGVAYTAGGGTPGVYISDEGDPGSTSPTPVIRLHRLSDGHTTDTLPVPAVFTDHGLNGTRQNKGFEALTLSTAGNTIWTANEESLKQDGSTSGFVDGTTVRLQRFTDSGLGFVADQQWAYVVDPINGNHPGIPDNNEQSRVSDMVVLPDGTVLVLEQATYYIDNSNTGFVNKIYQVDTVGATPLTSPAFDTLDGEIFTPVSKSLLWEQTFSVSYNFEGIALGPELNDGSLSLLLISDDGTPIFGQSAVQALRVIVPEPASLSIGLVGVLAGVYRRPKR